MRRIHARIIITKKSTYHRRVTVYNRTEPATQNQSSADRKSLETRLSKRLPRVFSQYVVWTLRCVPFGERLNGAGDERKVVVRVARERRFRNEKISLTFEMRYRGTALPTMIYRGIIEGWINTMCLSYFFPYGKKKIKERERKKTILYIANSLIARRRVGHYVPLRFGWRGGFKWKDESFRHCASPM